MVMPGAFLATVFFGVVFFLLSPASPLMALAVFTPATTAVAAKATFLPGLKKRAVLFAASIAARPVNLAALLKLGAERGTDLLGGVTFGLLGPSGAGRNLLLLAAACPACFIEVERGVRGFFGLAGTGGGVGLSPRLTRRRVVFFAIMIQAPFLGLTTL